MKKIFLVSGLAAFMISNANLKAQEAKPQTDTPAVTQVAQEVQASTPAPAQEQPAAPKATSWTDKIAILGDFRYRHEIIKEQGKDQRNRERIRARYGLKADPFNYLTAVFQLATSVNDPVSTNQDLGDGFSGKPVRVDLAYFDWHPNCEHLKGLHIYGGKMKNPFYDPGKSQLLWDGDLTPEGLSFTYERGIGNFSMALNFGGFLVQERSALSDTWLIGTQGVGKYNFMEGGKLYMKAAFGFFDYTALGGKPTVYDATKSFGNTVDAGKNYSFEYRELEVAGEIGGKIMNRPVAVFGDFVKNVAPNVVANKGYLFGCSAGEASDPWTWAIRYSYRKLEADAVYALFTNSDFIGSGTDGKGHEVGAELAVAKNVKFGVTWLNNKKTLSAPTCYNRIMIDFGFKI